MGEMRVVEYDRYGPPEVLRVVGAPVPVPSAEEVLVRVHGASVGGGDLALRGGGLRVLRPRRFPKRIGVDFAGEVVSAGGRVVGPAVGDRVWGALDRGTLVRGRAGALAEFVAVRPRQLAPAPAGVDLVAAAALPGVGTTAITALRDKARLRAGERLLVRGGTGGLGSVLVQLGRALGAHVTALASAPTLDLAVSLGAHEALDYRGTGPSALGAFDVVVDAVGTELAEYHRLVRPGGRFVALAPTTPAAVRHLAGSFLPWRERALFFSGNPGSRLFADLTSYVESGAVRPVVDTVFPLEEVAAAHHALARGGVRGKYVIRLR